MILTRSLYRLRVFTFMAVKNSQGNPYAYYTKNQVDFNQIVSIFSFRPAISQLLLLTKMLFYSIIEE